jgi:CHAD domain-containing protein
MAFRLRTTESVADGLRRLTKQELNSISTHLDGGGPPSPAAIHEVRKSVKKVSAILQVVAADNGHGLAKSATRLHTIHERLSALRDADVMLETLDTLKARDRGILNERCYARLRHQLSSHRKSAMKAARHKETSRLVVQSVRKIRRDARRWRPRHRQFGALAEGIRGTYQRGQRAMARAIKRQRATDFHEWRKQIKALWYELRLVERCSPRVRRDVRALQRTEAWLGDAHNVVVLCAELSKGGPEGESLIDLDRVRLAGDRYQSELQTKALATAKRVYASTPHEYVDAIRHEWKCARASA